MPISRGGGGYGPPAAPVVGGGGGASYWTGTVRSTDGSQADVQAKINAASSGDIVELPVGSFTWTSGITCGKGILLRGQGSGRVVARSASSVAVATGSKTFTVNASGLDITVGQTLRIERTGTAMSGGNPTGTRTWMEGTVSSYSGATLVMDITSTGGSGTHPLWIVISQAATTVTNNAGGSYLVDLTESTSGYLGVTGIKFVAGTGTNYMLHKNGRTASGYPILLWNCSVETNANPGLRDEASRGVIWNCSFASFPFSMAPVAIEIKGGPSWDAASTIGAADIGGVNNLYVEDTDFHAYLNATDNDDYGRSAWRRCVFNNAGFGTHGADTSSVGSRHFEVYESEFVFNGYNDGNTFNMNWLFYIRGGTYVITDNVMPAVTSTDYGTKTAVNMTVQNLRRNAGPYACWAGGYPAPHQVGYGHNGASQIAEPAYIWNNTGGFNIGLSDYSPDECSGGPAVSTFIQASRDYYTSAKSGYTKYTYPHPLRASSGETP